MSTIPENASDAVTPTPTPTTAVTMGSDAAMTVPSITMSTMAAKTRPTTSPMPKISGTPCARSVAKSTLVPSTGESWKCAIAASLVSSESSRRGSVKETLTMAVEPSAETTPMPSVRPRSVRPSSACSTPDSSCVRLASTVACCSWRVCVCASSWACCASSAAICAAGAPAASACCRAAVSCCWPASSCAFPASSCCCAASSWLRPAVIWAAPLVSCAAWSARCWVTAKGSTTRATPGRSPALVARAEIACSCAAVKAEPSVVR